jgi:hypothetical protein
MWVPTTSTLHLSAISPRFSLPGQPTLTIPVSKSGGTPYIQISPKEKFFMRFSHLFLRSSSLVAFTLCASAIPASADTIAWTNWTSATPGTATPGSATGTITSSTLGTITVTYSGQNTGLITVPSWTPIGTFTGGVVGNAPPQLNKSIQIEGGQTYTESVTFSTPVADPILAIWSLGQPGLPAFFDFNASEPFNVLGGGPSAEFGGSAIVKQGNNIFGSEGNGIVQFIGTYSTITFTTPNFENYYAITFGEDATLTDAGGGGGGGGGGGTTVPEPAGLSLLGLGLAALPFARARFARTRA